MPHATEESPGQRDRHEYPRSAFYLDCGAIGFGQPEGEGEEERVPVHMVIRSKEGVERFGERWFHDFAGMRRGERVAIDYRHDPDRLIGYLDRFEEKRDGMHAWGFLVPFGEDDKAREVVYRAQKGVPYEASIFFGGNGIMVEEVGASDSAQVNGKKIQGPAVIFRQWSLRGVAVCPHGADQQTRTQLSDEETIVVGFCNRDREVRDMRVKNQGDAAQVEDVQTATQGGELAEAVETAGAGDGAATGGGGQVDGGELAEGKGKATPPPLPSKAAEAGDDPRAECKRFLDAFGPKGGEWFAEGKTFAEAQALHAEALTAENADLRAKLSGVDRGEADAVSATPDGAGSKLTEGDQANFGGVAALVAHNRAAMGAARN